MRIVLDAGHGGSDAGASRNPFREKDFTLAIVRELKIVIENHELGPVYLTRDYDVFVPLGERCRIANLKNADVFLSIHLNADPDPDTDGTHEASGWEIWYDGRSDKSNTLAEELFKSIRRVNPNTRGTRSTEHLYVLKHTKMPAVLIEVGFVDSRHDVTLLTNPAYQTLLAEAIVQGLRRWAQSLGLLGVAPATPPSA